MRRSAAEWAVRGGLAISAVVLGYASVSRTSGYMTRTVSPERAHALAPSDGRVTGLYAQSLAGPEASTADRHRADQLAREAVRQDPMAITAITTLGLDAEVRGDKATAQRLFVYAGRLSRRDLQTQVWAIEDAVGRGDIAGALRHYDIALRTSRSAPDLLFPILAQAMDDPEIRSALIATLGRQPVWTQPFIEYVAGNMTSPQVAASLFAGIARARVPISDSARTAVVDALIKSGMLDTAWRYYATIRPGADRHRSRDPRFSAGIGTPSILDWTPVDGPGTSVAIADGMADVSASMGGPVLRQLQLLPPGAYRLDGHATPTGELGHARAYWALSCLDGRELGRVVLPDGASNMFAGRFVVPAGCPAQYLALILPPAEGAGASMQVDRVILRPAA